MRIKIRAEAGILTLNKHNLIEADLTVEGQEIDLEAVGVKTGNKAVDREDLLFLRTLPGLAVGMIMVVMGTMIHIGTLLKDFQMDQDQDGQDRAKDYLVVRGRDGSRFKHPVLVTRFSIQCFRIRRGRQGNDGGYFGHIGVLFGSGYSIL